MIEKAPDAYRTISEVAEDLDLPQHVLRFWETRFSQIKPLKRGGGRRYYRPDDVELLKGIRHLLYSEGYTIKGVQRILKEQGPKSVMAIAQGQMPPPDEGDYDDEGEVGTAFAAPEPYLAPAPAAPSRIMPQSPPTPAYAAPAPRPSAPPASHGAPQRFEPPMTAAPVHVSPPQQEWRPAEPPTVHHAPAPPAYIPPPSRGPDPYLTDPYGMARRVDPPAFAEPLPDPVAAPQPERPRPPPTVSYMRGGLSNPTLARKPVVPAPPPEPPVMAHPTINVRRANPLPPVEPPRFAPVPEDEPDEADYPAPALRYGLSDDSRRALQSALFELTECRRTIERITATRDR